MFDEESFYTDPTDVYGHGDTTIDIKGAAQLVGEDCHLGPPTFADVGKRESMGQICIRETEGTMCRCYPPERPVSHSHADLRNDIFL